MKTKIDLSKFNFNSRIFNQISDCPDTGFVRVLVYTGDNYQERIKKWFINAEIVFINQHINKIVYTQIAKSKNQEWVISNEYDVVILDFQGNPVINPDFITEREEEGQITPVSISSDNMPYLTQKAFDRFSEFRVGLNYSLSMRQLWNMSVASDDNNGYFDNKENHKNIVQVQIELYERFS